MPRGELLEDFYAKDVYCHYGFLRSAYDISLKKYIYILKIFKKYDILHLHGFNPFIALCAILSRKKMIYTEHGVFGFGRKKTRADSIKKLLKKVYLNKYVDFITFNSNFTKEYAEKLYKIHNLKNKQVVYNGIEFKRKMLSQNNVDPSLLTKIQDKFVVGTTSRFAGFKRIDRLLHAFAKFQVDRKAILLLVGDGILRKELEQLTKKLEIAEKTLFTGYKYNVWDYQNLMDVCVFPSKNEPFGLVAVETLSLGKPTIVFKDGGGITEIIENI
jgi:glycosyltransferase involved in cell wall biosynthesis